MVPGVRQSASVTASRTAALPSRRLSLPSVSASRSVGTIPPDVVHVHPTPASSRSGLTGAPLPRARCSRTGSGTRMCPEPSGWLVVGAECLITPSELVRTRVRERGATADRLRYSHRASHGPRREVDAGEAVDVVYAHRLDGSANVESLPLGQAEPAEGLVGDDHRRWAGTSALDRRRPTSVSTTA